MDSESTFLISSAGVWTLRLRKEGLTQSHLSHVTLITSLNQSGLLKDAPIDLLGQGEGRRGFVISKVPRPWKKVPHALHHF